MAEIIIKGNKHKAAKCEYCGCYFSYQQYETHKKGGTNYIPCPDCHKITKVIEIKNNIKMEDQ